MVSAKGSEEIESTAAGVGECYFKVREIFSWVARKTERVLGGLCEGLGDYFGIAVKLRQGRGRVS